MLLFLESLPEPVIPYRFQSKCMDASQNFILCKQVHFSTLIFEYTINSFQHSFLGSHYSMNSRPLPIDYVSQNEYLTPS